MCCLHPRVAPLGANKGPGCWGDKKKKKKALQEQNVSCMLSNTQPPRKAPWSDTFMRNSQSAVCTGEGVKRLV